MKFTALAVVILALGIVLGLALQDVVFEAEAAQPTQQREDQVTIFAGPRVEVSTANNPDWSSPTLGGDPIIALDGSDYPANAVFRLEATIHEATPTVCFRLFDLTGETPVSNSEICQEQQGTPFPPSRLRSEPFELPDSEHEYAVQGKAIGDSSAIISAARVIVDWTEGEGPVVAELPPGGGNPPQQSISAAGTPLPLPASIALGVLFVGAGGLYVMRIRRG